MGRRDARVGGGCVGCASKSRVKFNHFFVAKLKEDGPLVFRVNGYLFIYTCTNKFN